MIYGADHQNLPEPSDAFYASILRLLPWSPNVKDGMYTVREYGVFRVLLSYRDLKYGSSRD